MWERVKCGNFEYCLVGTSYYASMPLKYAKKKKMEEILFRK